jgi:hypothetical protein
LLAKTAPFRTLLEEKNEFQWSNEQEKCFEELKEILSKEPVLNSMIQRDQLKSLRIAQSLDWEQCFYRIVL